jgi:hypothetical protein
MWTSVIGGLDAVSFRMTVSSIGGLLCFARATLNFRTAGIAIGEHVIRVQSDRVATEAAGAHFGERAEQWVHEDAAECPGATDAPNDIAGMGSWHVHDRLCRL